MATPKTYVSIKKLVINDVFDAKYKTSLLPVIQKAAEAAVKSAAKLTTDEPKEKGAKGYTLDGSLVSLGPDKAGKKLKAECKMVISTWPGKAIQAMPSGSVSMAIDDADKIDPGDVTALAQAAVEGAMKEATRYMEKNAP
jgi:hypothetical protein